MALKLYCCHKNCKGSTRSRRSAVTLNPATDFCHAQTFVRLFNEHSDCRWCWTDNFQTFGVACCRPRLFSFGVLSASAFENGPGRPPKIRQSSSTGCLSVPDQSFICCSFVAWISKYPISLETKVRLWWKEWQSALKYEFWSDKQRGW